MWVFYDSSYLVTPGSGSQIIKVISHYFFQSGFCSPLSYSSYISIMHTLVHLMVSHSLKPSSLFSILFFSLFYSSWVSSTVLYLNSLILSFSWSSLFLNTSIKFQVFYFLAFWFLFVTFKCFLLLCWNSHFCLCIAFLC